MAPDADNQSNAPDLIFDGERFIPGAPESEIDLEHFHRYLATAEIVHDKRVLDMACGTGYGSHLLSKTAAEVVGLDISVEAVAFAASRFSSPNLRYVQGDCTAPPFEDHSFDTIVSFETLEHITNHDAFLDACKRLLKPGGALIISTPERGRYNAQLASPNEHHLKELTEHEFHQLLKARFQNVCLAGQRVVFGSLIVPGRAGATKLHSICQTPSGADVADAYDRSIYLLAHCSDQAPPPLPAGLYEGAFPPNAVSSLIGGIREREEQIMGLRRELEAAGKQADARVAGALTDESISRELFAQAAMIASFRARLRAIEDELGQSNTARQHIEALLAGANAELVGRREEAGWLQTQLADAQSDFEELLAVRVERIRELEEALAAQLEGMTAVGREVVALRARVLEAEYERDELSRDKVRIQEDFKQDQARFEAMLARAVSAETWLEAERRRADTFEARVRDSERTAIELGSQLKLAEVGNAKRETNQSTDLARLSTHFEGALDQQKRSRVVGTDTLVDHRSVPEPVVADTCGEGAADADPRQITPAVGDAARANASAHSSSLQSSNLQGDRFHTDRVDAGALGAAYEDELTIEDNETPQEAAAILAQVQQRLVRQRHETNRVYDQVRNAIRLLDASREDMQHAIDQRQLAEAQLRRERFVGKRAAASLWRLVRRWPALALPVDFLVFMRHAGLLNLTAAVRFTHEAYILRKSRAVDEMDYVGRYFDVRIRGVDPVRHYLLYGANEGRDPRRDFSTRGYLAANADVRESKANPLVHHVRYGKAEGRHLLWPGVSRLAGQRTPDSRSTEDAHSGRQAAVTEPYKVRPDDVVGSEAHRGQAFLRRYDLLSQSPDFSGAIESLSAAKPTVQDGGTAPRVSIVIPIYGQLAYTLNCLDSLSRHNSRYPFEVIVVDDRSPDESYAHLQRVPWIRLLRNDTNQGFLKTCNLAVEQARGSYVVLLNNDTRVVEGWLDEMIESYDRFPRAGLVGSKLFFEDGSLQEAGGIIWRDGSAWNYGRNDDPAKPEYCFARRVDYVSGCSISLPMTVWRDLGGFDEVFRPAYCEDSDLAMRVREAGLEVWMQPLSRVIHYEGKTSGTDLTQGVKAYQVKNSKTLFERWRHRLVLHGEHGQNPLRESNRCLPMRALLIDAVTPTPTMDAGSVTTTMTLQILQLLGYAPTFVPADNFLFFPPHTPALQRAGIQTAYVPFDMNFEDHMRRHGSSYDFIIVYRIGVLQGVLPLIRQYAPQAPVAFHNIDMHFLRLERQAALAGDSKLLEQARQVKEVEIRALREVDCTIVHSEVEQTILQAEDEDAKIIVFPYMTELVGTKVPFEDRRDIMFLGGYSHSPNEDAFLHFVRESWPVLRKSMPGAKFFAVGANPTEAMQAFGSKDVIITGHVQDLKPFFDRCRVFVCPLRYGAGVKGKISTSMAHGLPVVSTSIGTEGMGLSSGSDVVVADSEPDFLEAVRSVYTDESRWLALSKAGLAFVSEHNSYGMGVRKVGEVIEASRRQHAARTRRD